MFNLKDRVALVTGASQGIGRATALALAQAGARVAAAARNAEKLAGVVAEITSACGEALAVKMDVADAEQVKSGFRTTLEKFGKLDILVNNAAITRDGLAVRMNCTAAWRAFSTLSDMLPLISNTKPMETGTSSLDNVSTSCSLLFSKTRKFSFSRPTTRRSDGSMTVTFTSVRSTSTLIADSALP